MHVKSFGFCQQMLAICRFFKFFEEFVSNICAVATIGVMVNNMGKNLINHVIVAYLIIFNASKTANIISKNETVFMYGPTIRFLKCVFKANDFFLYTPNFRLSFAVHFVNIRFATF